MISPLTRLRFGRRRVSLDLGELRRNDLALRVGVHEGEHVLGVGVGGGGGAFGGARVALGDAPRHLVDALGVEHAGVEQFLLVGLDRVDRLPGRLLLLGAVLVARIAQRVAPVAVAVGLDQHRPLAFAAELRGAQHGVAHGQHVHAVDDLGVHVLSAKPAARRARRRTPDTSSSARPVMP